VAWSVFISIHDWLVKPSVSVFENVERGEAVLEQVPKPWSAFFAKGVHEWDRFKGGSIT
jgi:hypothetical protein